MRRAHAPPLLHDGVEEGQNVYQRPERRVGAAVQGLVRDLAVGLEEVGLEAVGRLSHDLDGALREWMARGQSDGGFGLCQDSVARARLERMRCATNACAAHRLGFCRK